MTGLCGVLGGERVAPEMVDELAWTGEERRHSFTDSTVDVHSLVHDSPTGSGSATVADGEVTVWLDGIVYGFEDEGAHTDDGGYHRREDVDPAELCGRLYEEYGPRFVAGLNGGFAGVVYDRGARTVSMFTDRLGTRELFYARPEDRTLVFSSRLQGIPLHPSVSTTLDGDYLLEYFACRRSFGVTTPLEGVRLVPPGSVLTVDLAADDLGVDTERYWAPRHRPVDAPFSGFVDEFVDLVERSVAERTDTGGTCGVLLSGGSDARLVLAALDGETDVVAYHIADWMSPEARRAEHIAQAAGVEFRYLRRGPDYYERLLERTPELSNFVQRFHQAFAEGFMDRIRDEVDYLVTGHFADTWFRGHHLPTRPGPTSVGRRPREITSTDEFVDYLLREAPAYVDATTADLRDVLAGNVVRRDGSVLHHGVEFDSLRDLGLYGRLVPRGTDPFFRQSLRENLPFRPPLLDNRLIDLATRMPLEYQQRRNVVDAAVERLAPELAAIPSANTGVPLTSPYPVKRAAGVLTRLSRRLLRRAPLPGVGPPRPWQNYGAWGDHPGLIRRRDFVPATLSRHEGTFDRVPLLDRAGAWRCYEEHLDGANRTSPLYALLTFLEMPVVDRLYGDCSNPSDGPDHPDHLDHLDHPDRPDPSDGGSTSRPNS